MARDDDLNALQDLAERMQLDEKETDNFINSGMKRLGYVPRMDWDEPENQGGDEGGDFFSNRREQRRSREVRPGGRQQEGRRASGGSNWQYDNDR